MAKAKSAVPAAPKSTGMTVFEEEMAKEAEDAAAKERPASGMISLRGGVMTYQEQPIKDNTFLAVILDSVHENRFYTERFDPENPSSPVCFALSGTGDSMAPHELSVEKQHETCEGCPRLEWGSALNGSRGKACGEVRRLAVIPVSALESAEAVKTSELAVLKVPVTSVKNWANYVNNVRNMHRRPPYGMVTEIKLVPDAKTQFKLLFSAKGLVDSDELLGAIRERRASVQNVLMVPYEQQAEAEEETSKPQKKAGRKKY